MRMLASRSGGGAQEDRVEMDSVCHQDEHLLAGPGVGLMVTHVESITLLSTINCPLHLLATVPQFSLGDPYSYTLGGSQQEEGLSCWALGVGL